MIMLCEIARAVFIFAAMIMNLYTIGGHSRFVIKHSFQCKILIKLSFRNSSGATVVLKLFFFFSEYEMSVVGYPFMAVFAL